MYRFGLAFIVVVSCGAPLFGGADDRSREALAIDEAVKNIVKEAEPSIACILITRSERPVRPGGEAGVDLPQTPRTGRPGRTPSQTDSNKGGDPATPEYVPEAYCSGVVIDAKEQLVLTNYQTVREARQILVRLPGNKSSRAEIYAGDPRSDLAVLRLLDPRVGVLKAIKFGDGGAVQKGQVVLTLANSYASGFQDASPTVSWGLISNLRQKTPALNLREENTERPLYVFGTLLQTDARLHCAGGTLLNLHGEMIGLTNLRVMVSGSDMAGGYALPMDASIKRIIEQLRQGKEVEYGFLGVKPPEKDKGLIGDGVPIIEVVPGSPAYRAQLRPGEVIQSVNGVRLRNSDDLFLALGTALAGSEARLEIKGRNNVVRVLMAKNLVHGKIIAAKRPPLVRGFRVDYTSVLYLQSSFPRWGWGHFGIQPGVYVSEIQPGSPAALALLQANDVITHVNEREINSPADFYEAVTKVAPQTPLKLTLAGNDFNRLNARELTIP